MCYNFFVSYLENRCDNDLYVRVSQLLIYDGLDESVMNKNLALVVIAVIVLSVIATTMMEVTSSYATDGILKKNQPKSQPI
jgi:hypothetical protein